MSADYLQEGRWPRSPGQLRPALTQQRQQDIDNGGGHGWFARANSPRGQRDSLVPLAAVLVALFAEPGFPRGVAVPTLIIIWGARPARDPDTGFVYTAGA